MKDWSTSFCVDHQWVNAVMRDDTESITPLILFLGQNSPVPLIWLVDIGKWKWALKIGRKLHSVHKADCLNLKKCLSSCVIPPQRFNNWWTWFWLVCSGQLVWSIRQYHNRQDFLRLFSFRRAGLMQKPKKCDFFSIQVDLFCHIVSADGQTQTKLKRLYRGSTSIQTSRWETKQFVELANYSRPFLFEGLC